MTLYKDVIRRLLRTTEGYECQETEGNFMLVFHKPMRAVQFCLLVRAGPHLALLPFVVPYLRQCICACLLMCFCCLHQEQRMHMAVCSEPHSCNGCAAACCFFVSVNMKRVSCRNISSC